MSASRSPGEACGFPGEACDSPGEACDSPGEARADSAGVPRQDPHVDATRFDATPVNVARVDLAKLERLAVEMARSLPSGLTFALVGTLGAGKTRMTQAIAGALGIDRAEVTSPTFTLVQSHQVGGSAAGVRRLHHLDAYRLCDEDEFLDLGVEELFADTAAWTIVEWADRVADAMPSDTVWVSIEIEPIAESRSAESGVAVATEGSGERRRIVFQTDDAMTRAALHELARAIPHDSEPSRPEAARSEPVDTDTPEDDRSNPPRDGAESP